MFQVREEVNRFVVLFQGESQGAFEAFLNDPEVKETPKSSGTMELPESTMLDKSGEFPS